MKRDINKVKKIFEEVGCVCKSNKYINGRIPLQYICSCGKESAITLDNFLAGVRCGCKRKRIFYDDVLKKFKENNCLLLEKEYINSNTPMKYICVCGNESRITFWKFRNGQRCQKCKGGRLSVKFRTTKIRQRRSDWWRKEIISRDKKCQKCGNYNKLNAHHLDGFDIFPEKRNNLDNGIALCITCHNDFHNLYGRGMNTKMQFEEWINEKRNY